MDELTKEEKAEVEAKELAKKAEVEAKELAKKAAEELDPSRVDPVAPEVEKVGAFKAVYRELLPDGTRKGAIAYKDFKTKKEAEKFAEATEGKLV